MTPDKEDRVADRLLGIEAAPLVIPDGEMGTGCQPDGADAASLACGAGLPVLTETEPAIAASSRGLQFGSPLEVTNRPRDSPPTTNARDASVSRIA